MNIVTKNSNIPFIPIILYHLLVFAQIFLKINCDSVKLIMDPYKVLNVSPNDSTEHIENVCRNYIKLLHPDKAHTSDAKRLGMSESEKREFLEMIHHAYEKIMELRSKEQYYPDYKMDYKVEKDFRIKKTVDYSDHSSGFNSQKFNEDFEKKKLKNQKNGLVDAYERGYNVFDKGKDYSDDNKQTIKAQQYSMSGIDTSSKMETHVPDMKDGRLVEYSYEDMAMNDDYKNEYYNYDLTHISDFSMTTSGKCGIGGTDLMKAYGKNFENWEDTIKRDTNIYNKYSDNTDVSKKMLRFEVERNNGNIVPMRGGDFKPQMSNNNNNNNSRIDRDSDKYYGQTSRRLLM